MKLFRNFAVLFPLDSFSSHINLLAQEKSLLKERETTRLTQILESYKQYPEHYNKDLVPVVKLFCLLKSENLSESMTEVLEKEIYKNYEKVPSEELVQYTLFCKPRVKHFLTEYIIRNSGKFTNEQLTVAACNSYKDSMLVELQKKEKFEVRDLQIGKKVAFLTNNPIVLLELTRQLPGMIKNGKDLEVFLEILMEIEQKDIHLAQNLAEYLEQKLLNSDLKLDFTAIKLILRLFKSKGLHLSFSSSFYKYFISSITYEISRPKNMRTSFYLSLFGKEQLNIDSVNKYLVAKFKTEALVYKEYRDALSGFEGCSVLIVFDQELIDLFHSFISINIENLNKNELIRVLKIFITQGLYYQKMLDLVLDQLVSLNLKLITQNDQVFLEDNFELILIDLPEMKKKLETIKKYLFPRYQPKHYTISNTQNYVNQALIASNIQAVQNQYLGKVYEVDFLLPDAKIVIEAIGTLYHFNMFSKQLTPKTLVKIRHLAKLGYKTILTISKESTENHLKKAIFFLNNFKNQAVLLLEDEIKVIDAFQEIRRN